MKTWVDLYRAHTESRGKVGKTWSSEIRRRLRALAAAHCEETSNVLFTNKAKGRLLEEWRLASVLVLQNIPEIASAKLDVLVLCNPRTGHIHQLTITAKGQRSADGSLWTIAVHLADDRDLPDEDRQGLGACSHAALHCHVGPDLDTSPAVRVPLPALGPAEALDWVISQVIPTRDFEPAGWDQVQAMLAKNNY